ncbi:MAG: hypothetical protein Q4F49_07335 [Pseudoxanthomonas suwonensis]|nr:hypothetical protein [Pseudoxanthomonas suwonensis]
MERMAETGGYAVFLFPQAIEALGDAIRPFLSDSPMGAHIACRDVDTGGALMQLGVLAQGSDGGEQRMTLMLPASMVRLVVSRAADPKFGFGPRTAAVAPPSIVQVPGTPAEVASKEPEVGAPPADGSTRSAGDA